MSNWQLNDDGDLDVVNNSIVFTSGIDRFRQRIKCRFLFFLGEWFLDTSLGVPWFRDILVKDPSFPIVLEVLKDVILDTDGIIGLISFTFDFTDPRELDVNFQALSIDGPVDFTDSVEVLP